MMKNIGEMTNRGVEVEINYDIVRTKDWYVNFHTTYSYNTNKIDKLFYGLDQWDNKGALVISPIFFIMALIPVV
jgi:outer membrane receptor protein involved in Fe transport